MFQRIGAFAARYRFAVIAGWALLAAVLLAVAPDLAAVSSTDQADFLPADAPFVQAQALYERTFPEEANPSNSIVLIDARAGGDVRGADAWQYMQALESWLNGPEAPANVTRVAAPTTDPEFADALISPDGRIALVSIGLSTPTDAALTTEAIGAIEKWLAAHPPSGFDVYQTGEAALNAQAEESTFTTMDRTIFITIALVIVALLLIYRSPVSPFIPLVTVTAAFLVTIGLVAILAGLGVIKVVTQINALLVVVMYGAGTDYCLFLISRFREEMANDPDVARATRHTVHMVGETIASSAGTIFVGFVSLVFSEMGIFKSAGPMLATGIAVSLLAGLTLAPALLAALGNRAFWPGKASHRSSGRLYAHTSKLVSTRPLATIALIVALMAPFSAYGLNRELNYDMVSELPQDIDSVRAYRLLREHMGGGNLFPLTVVVTGRDAQAIAAEAARLEAELAGLDGVADVRGLDYPLGREHASVRNLLRVDGQLELLLQQAAQDGGAADMQDALAVIAGMQRYFDLLAERFPALASDPHLATIREILGGNLLGVMARQQELMGAIAGLAERCKTMDDAYLLPPAGEGELFAALQPVLAGYLAAGGTAYRVEVVLDDPLSAEGLRAAGTIRDMLARHAAPGAAGVSGFPAVVADIQDVMARDQLRTFAFVLAGIFLVLLVMLRSVVAPLYLIGTVLLSFTCTLGLTGLFFRAVFGVEKLSWMLPVFMFVFLVALGIDYSIFLFGRIKEEVARHGVREGVHAAVAATGAIITSAGVILAGTFAGMLAGEMMFLAQLGFAVSVGVLIDTFVVRTVLDPALAAFCGRWTWWPGGVPRGESAPVSA